MAAKINVPNSSASLIQAAPAPAAVQLSGSGAGLVQIPSHDQPLVRLNFFDGKFLRANDLTTEQEYVRRLVALSNVGGGNGVVNGFDVTASGADGITIASGLAIDPEGRVLMYPHQIGPIAVGDLIAASTSAISAVAEVASNNFVANPDFGDCAVVAKQAEI